MEIMVKSYFENYHIIRIGNITWGDNPNTFINFIRERLNNNEPVQIRDEWKYLISKEELLMVVDNLPLKGQSQLSIFGECKKVKDCL